MVQSFSAAELKQAFSLYATGVALATTCVDDQPVGITVNSFSSVSIDPPLVLFSVNKALRSHDLFRSAPGFAINILGKNHKELSNRFARSGADKWSGLDVAKGRAGGILLPDAISSFDCRRYQAHDSGDHTIFVGEVLAISRSGQQEPLLYFRSSYQELAGAIAQP